MSEERCIVDTTSKIQTILDFNTFFYVDPDFEERFDSQTVTAIANLLAQTHHKVRQAQGPTQQIYEELLQHPLGLRALLALTAFSNELLKRIITVARLKDDTDLNALLYRHDWAITEVENFTEWSSDRIQRLVLENKAFRRGIANLFFGGASNPLLVRILSPFHVKKLGIRKLSFEPDAMIDTLIRYKESGARTAQGEGNPERVIERLLADMNLAFEAGDLPIFASDEANRKRTIDFIIPDKQHPRLIIECSYLTTTSSGQGDKAKTEQGVADLIRRHYPQARFVGFIDGVGWLVRRRDLGRMVQAYDDVFTFHEQEIARFRRVVEEALR